MFIRNILKLGRLPRRLAPGGGFSFSKQPRTQGSFTQFDVKVNYYKVMEVQKDATIDDINKAYGKLYSQYEGDENKGPGSRMEQLNQAYRILSNQRVRKEYNYQRFISRVDQKMQENYEGKTTGFSSDYLTPEEEKVYRKFNRKLKYFLMTITAIAMFSPFFLWKGGQVQHNQIISQDDPVPKRHRGGYLDGSAFKQQNQPPQGHFQPPAQQYNQYQGGANQGQYQGGANQGQYQGGANQGQYQGGANQGQGRYGSGPVYGMNPPGVQVSGQFVED